MQVRAGCFLIASPTLRDPNFARSVVLLCEHGDKGSMGVVVNRPTEHSVAEAITGMPVRATQRLFWGGPVQQHVVLVLHRHSIDTPEGREVVDGMSLGGDSEALVQILESDPEPHTRVRVFSGYAGWGAGQLDAEMEERSWIVHPGSARLVFDVEPDSIWSAALREMGPRYAHWTSIPLDPRVN